MMIYHKHIKKILTITGFFFIAACEAPQAYVQIEEEFNRKSAVFLNGVTSREGVKVCYHKDGTTPQQVAALAERECKKFYKRAVFIEQNLSFCPLATPISAIFQCVK
jgi:hypothetical protein